MKVYLNRSGNNIFFWSHEKQEDSYAEGITESTSDECTLPDGEFRVGSVLRNGPERLKIVEITEY